MALERCGLRVNVDYAAGRGGKAPLAAIVPPPEGPAEPPLAGRPAGRSLWLPALFGLGLPLAWLLAWLSAGRLPWWSGAVLAAVGVPLALWRKSWAAAGFAVAAAVLWAGVAFVTAFPVCAVHLDNHSGREVRLEVDGAPGPSLAHGRTALLNLRAGRHELVVRSADGAELRRLPVETAGPSGWRCIREEARRSGILGLARGRRPKESTYVLNVLGAATYYRGRITYGLPTFGRPREEKITDEWFRPEVDYLFEKPPGSVRAPAAAVLTSRDYLRRATQPWW